MKPASFRLLFRIMVITALISVGAAAGKTQRDHAHDGWVAQSPTAMQTGAQG
ncbi:MAG: hypothetical protein H7123_02990 [Thermoleophilia bacterium]|nr:hypothetical protein [Thermoleophilia bacterium]